MIDPKDLFVKAENAAEDWADKDFAAGMLEDSLSVLEGQIATRLKMEGNPISIISKLIKSQPEWFELSKNWRTARKAALIARLKYEQVNRYQDNVRTKESTERALAR